jgi:hypothetical protein
MDTQNIINVDIDSRAVTLPSNFNLGVTNDNSCKTITFMVQKKSDITDLTDLTFSVNTISAKGTPDKLECDCREEGGFYIITALLKGTIFEASGKAVFNLCGQKFDSSHVAVKAWGSEDITASVSEHSHADKAIEELYPSILEELKQKIENPNLTDEQLSNIATKVAEKGFYTKSEIDSTIDDIVVPTRLSQLAEDDSHVAVTRAQKTKIDDVPTSFKTINNQTIIGTGNIDIPAGRTGTSITVDSALSSTSVNPVQNKVIKSELDKKANTTDSGVKKVIHTASDTNVTINSNEYHVFPTMASLTITPGAVGTDKMFICGFEFVSGSTPTALTLTGCTLSNSDDVTTGTYEVNILGTSAIVRLR